MNNKKFQAKILKIIIFVSTLLIFSKGVMFNNSYLISENPNANPINPICSRFGGCSIFTSEKYYVVGSEGLIQSNSVFEFYQAPYTWKRGFNYFYIFTYFKYINVKNSGGGYSCELLKQPSGSNLVYPNSRNYIGSIFEFGTSENCKIQENQLIIYGKRNSENTNYLCFTFLIDKKSYIIKINGNLEDKIECKIKSGGSYMCAMVQDNTVHIHLFSYENVENICTIIESHDQTTKMTNHTYVQLYDPFDISYSGDLDFDFIMCAKSIDTKEIECITIIFKNQLLLSEIKYRFPTSSIDGQDLAISWFEAEMLFCWADNDFIQCYRMKLDEDKKIISTITYKLNVPGSNSKIYISPIESYIQLFFINTNSVKTGLYEYLIYLPSCQDFAYTIIVYHSANEEKADIEKVDLNKLFERKTNTAYYVEFDSLPDQYGYLKVNDEKITGENSKILLEINKQYILDFISTNSNSVNNLKIPYKILIEETTYSANCSIDLTILPCYDLCEQCSKDNSASSSDKHNCLICKSGYYFHPSISTNCLREEEKESNWYIDYEQNRFGICDKACSTCTWGKNNLTNNTNCINCAEGYFKTQDSNTNCILESLIPENYLKNNSDNIYYKCHSNCKTCNDYYNFAENDMHCTQCPNDFYYLYGTNNCYNMSFVDENSYYLSEEDDKYHQCYLNCLRCSQPGSDESNQNCDKCISGFYFENSTKNCYNDSILERGYYLDNFSISQGEEPTYKKCYENCKTCNNTITNNSNMNCISCNDNLYKINGTNSCYNETLKAKGYYLAEDPNDSNNKIFYECYFSCALCDKGKESSNHNCLACRENFYPKKDDINPSNCYNESEMVPQGYRLIGNYWTFYDENNITINSTNSLIETTIYSTTPLKETTGINNTSKNRKTNLIGFSNTKNSKSRKISESKNAFNIYFYDEDSLSDYVYLDFPVEIETKTNEINRAIYELTKQKNEANSNCEKIKQKNKNIYGYSCEFEAEIDNKKSAVKIVDTNRFKFSTLNKTFKYFSATPSPLAKLVMDDLQNIPEIFDALIDSNLYILEHSKIERNKSLYFNISGIIEENPKFQKTNITLMVYAKSENETLVSENNCTIIDIANNNYKFNCRRKKGEEFDLDNSLFITNDDVILINFDNSSNATTTINYEDSEKTSNRIYYSKKKGELSAGAIVAIALALICAIASFIVVMIYLRRDKPEKENKYPTSIDNLKEI